MSSAFIFLVLLSLSVHACNARHLRGAPKHSMKVVKKVTSDKPSTPATMVQSNSPAELQSQPKKPVKVQVEADHESVTGAITGKTKDPPTRTESVEGRSGVASGIENLAHMGLQRTSELEETGEQARWVAGFRSSAIHVSITAEEHAVYGGTDVVEDADDMDYQQPHRKPPIHNESP